MQVEHVAHHLKTYCRGQPSFQAAIGEPRMKKVTVASLNDDGNSIIITIKLQKHRPLPGILQTPKQQSNEASTASIRAENFDNESDISDSELSLKETLQRRNYRQNVLNSSTNKQSNRQSQKKPNKRSTSDGKSTEKALTLTEEDSDIFGSALKDIELRRGNSFHKDSSRQSSREGGHGERSSKEVPPSKLSGVHRNDNKVASEHKRKINGNKITLEGNAREKSASVNNSSKRMGLFDEKAIHDPREKQKRPLTTTLWSSNEVDDDDSCDTRNIPNESKKRNAIHNSKAGPAKKDFLRTRRLSDEDTEPINNVNNRTNYALDKQDEASRLQQDRVESRHQRRNVNCLSNQKTRTTSNTLHDNLIGSVTHSAVSSFKGKPDSLSTSTRADQEARKQKARIDRKVGRRKEGLRYIF